MLSRILGISQAPMSLDEFWEIFSLYGKDEKEAKRVLKGRKKAYSKHYNECLLKAHSWDLWGAAYVIYGGCSDDSFTDFKGGLLLQGREVFEKAIADPESLMELSDRTLKDLMNQEFGSSGEIEPSGEPWEENEEDLKARYPRLWARFGETPIG